MDKRLKIFLLSACLWAARGVPSAIAQNIDDTAFRDTAQSIGVEGAVPINGEYVPERPIIYNAAAPTSADWEKTLADKAYNYRDKLEYVEKGERPRDMSGLYRLIYAIASFLASSLGKTILWTSLILIVGYVAYRIIKGQAGGLFEKSDYKTDLTDEIPTEHSLLESDWEHLLQEALNKGEGRAAIRFAYLRLLQLLHERGLIAYRPDKTNMDYYRELADKPQRQSFRSITRQYEWAWYGHVLPDKAAMDSYLQTFQELKQSMGTA